MARKLLLCSLVAVACAPHAKSEADAKSGESLSAAAVEEVVDGHAKGAGRACAGYADEGSKTTVRTTLVVATDGTVSGFDASGGELALRNCLLNQVRSWKFPPADKSTTVKLPFVFD